MNSGATIFDDRETVEFLRDHPHLLAIADAVRATQSKRTRSALRRTPLLVAAVVACATAATLIAFLVVPGAGTQHIGAQGHGKDTPHHTALPPANPVPLDKAQSDALNWFGAPLTLPDTSVLGPSDSPTALEQWCARAPEAPTTPLCQVNVQFASPAVNIEYVLTSHTWGSRYPDALDQYRAEIAQATDPSEYQIVSVSGTPALIGTGKTGNSIEFRSRTLSITVWAPDNKGTPTTIDAATLQALAQSIVDQAG